MGSFQCFLPERINKENKVENRHKEINASTI